MPVIEIEVTVDVGDAEPADPVARGGAQTDHQGAAAAEHRHPPIRRQPGRKGVADLARCCHQLAMADQAAARVTLLVVYRRDDVAAVGGHKLIETAELS